MIRILSPQIANKIAAGEVVERPASVVKELVENSLDADASEIRIDLEEGGKKLIRVQDNGCGIGPDDLGLAFAPHATSKINKPEDLFSIMSFGFRGEALASIGSVARASIVSRQEGEELGHRIEVDRSVISEVSEAGAPLGTCVEVKDLFVTIPARRKFLKSDAAEVARISEVLTRVALARPDLKLECYHNQRRVFRCEGGQSLEERIYALFGKDLKGALLPIEKKRDGLLVRGFIAEPRAAKPSASRQFIFLNDRFIKDRSLSHAVAQGFHGFLMPKRFPVFFLAIDIDPKAVDVNVHPTKIEVRFRDRNFVFTAIQSAVKNALAESRPSGRLEFKAPQEAPTPIDVASPIDSKGKVTPTTGSAGRVAEMEQTLFGGFREQQNPARPASIKANQAAERRESGSKKRSCHGAARPQARGDQANYRRMHLHNAYILVEDDDGLCIIDQHALHERMIYEELLGKSEAGEVPCQGLLIPEIVELSPAEHLDVLSLDSELASLGIKVADFGGHSIAVESLPLCLGKVSAHKVLDAVLSRDNEDVTAEFHGMRNRILAGIACRSAVKFNDSLSEAQIDALLEWEQTSENSAACPHGRPTRVRVSLAELYTQFLRKE